MSTAASPESRTTGSDDAGAPRTGRLRWAMGLLLAVVGGMGIALQGRINSGLAAASHDSFFAAVCSFGGGCVLLTALAAAVPSMRAGVRGVREELRAGRLRGWQCLGGAAGATLVAGQSLTIASLGVAMFTVGVVAGQTMTSLLVDRVGLGPAGRQALTWTRVAGAALMLLAVLGSLSGGLGQASGPWLVAMPVVAGVLVAVQQAINGRVSAAAGSSWTATWLNFSVGGAVLLLAWLVSLAVRGGPTALPGNPALYLGALPGILFIGVAALVVGWIGVLLLGLGSIAGQLIGSVLMDLLLPSGGGHLQPATLIGVGVALAAVGLAAVPSRALTAPRQRGAH